MMIQGTIPSMKLDVTIIPSAITIGSTTVQDESCCVSVESNSNGLVGSPTQCLSQDTQGQIYSLIKLNVASLNSLPWTSPALQKSRNLFTSVPYTDGNITIMYYYIMYVLCSIGSLCSNKVYM